jgi:hypothetical protein
MGKRLGNTNLDLFTGQTRLHFIQLLGNCDSVYIVFFGIPMRLGGSGLKYPTTTFIKFLFPLHETSIK